jgi:Flp pilus assembly protein TadD
MIKGFAKSDALVARAAASQRRFFRSFYKVFGCRKNSRLYQMLLRCSLRRVTFIGGLALLTACAGAKPQPVVSDSTRTELSRVLVEAGEPEVAATVLNDPARQPARSVPATLQPALLLIDLGHIDQGATAAREALAARGDDPAFGFQVARLLDRAGQLAAAGEVYRQILARHPDNVDALVGDGVVRAQTGNVPGAIAAFRQALVRRPNDVAAQANLRLALELEQPNGP